MFGGPDVGRVMQRHGLTRIGNDVLKTALADALQQPPEPRASRGRKAVTKEETAGSAMLAGGLAECEIGFDQLAYLMPHP
jgi:hypothetical protein